MKIRLFSDMHTEFRKDKLDIPELPTDKDTVLILAGDIGVGTSAVNPIIRLSDRFKHILYVAGNHEYYDQNMTVLRHYLATKAFDFQDTNITFLDNECTEIDDVWFYGGTMWTDMARHKVDEWHIRWRIQNSMNDFHCIRHRDENIKWTPGRAAEEHDEFNKNLEFFIQTARTEEKKMFVITHHAPSATSVEEKFKNNDINYGYHAHQEELISNNDDVLKWWVHGHMHHTVDYNIGKTRIFSNPYGYHNCETNPNYEPEKVWEI